MNKAQIESNVYCSAMNKTFENIVGRIFVNSIPIDRRELTPKVRKDLTKYAVQALESAGGINLLTNAIQSETNRARKNLMLQMFTTCDNASKEIASRIAFETTAPAKKAGKSFGPNVSLSINKKIAMAVKSLKTQSDYKKIFDTYPDIRVVLRGEDIGNGTRMTIVDGEHASSAKPFIKAVCSEVKKELTSDERNAWDVTTDAKNCAILITKKAPATESAFDFAFDMFEDDIMIATEANDDETGLDDIAASIGADDDDEEKDDDEDADKDDDESDDSTDDDSTNTNDDDDDDGDDGDDDKDDEEKAENPAITVRSIQTANLDAHMTEEEYAKFSKDVEKLDTAKISDIVNDKIVNAISEERENYHAMDESNARLKEAILKDDAVADENAAEAVMESMLAYHTDKCSEYTSLFSKLQVAAVESLTLMPNVDFNNIDADILTNITVNSTFEEFHGRASEASLSELIDKAISMQIAMEGAGCDECEECGGEECDDKSEKFVALGTAFATIIYTFLETLNTLGLVKADTQCVKGIVEKDTTVTKSIKDMSNEIDGKVAVAMEQHDKRINKARSIEALETVLVDLGRIKGKLVDASEMGYKTAYKHIPDVDHMVEKARTKLAAIESASNIVLGDTSCNDRYITADILSMDRVAKFTAPKRLSLLDMYCTESANGISIDVRGMRGNDQVYSTHVNLEAAHEGICMEDYVSLITKKSKLASSNVRIHGKNKTI